MAALFGLGRVVATPGALSLLAATATDAAELLERHQGGDWGEVPPEDAREDARSLKYGWRVLSSYPVGEDGSTVLDARRRLRCISSHALARSCSRTRG